MEGAEPHLQLVIMRLAAAVTLLGRLLIRVEEEAKAAVVAHLDMLHTCSQRATPAQQLALQWCKLGLNPSQLAPQSY